MPTSFLTSTLFLSILFIFEERTKVIIIGRPSGTATTMIVTAKVNAYIMCGNNMPKFFNIEIILSISKLLFITITVNKYEKTTSIAPIYPHKLIIFARPRSFVLSGLSG